MRERLFVHESLKIGMFVLQILCAFLTVSFVNAATPKLHITIGTFSPYYSPNLAHVNPGTPITWENPTATLHSITHDGCKTGDGCAFDSGAIGPHRTFTVPHLQPGRYSYHCTFHPIMQGVVVVLESDIPSET